MCKTECKLEIENESKQIGPNEENMLLKMASNSWDLTPIQSCQRWPFSNQCHDIYWCHVTFSLCLTPVFCYSDQS